MGVERFGDWERARRLLAQQPGARTIQREQRQALSLVRPTLLATTLQVHLRRSPMAQGQLIHHLLHQPAQLGDFAG